MKKVLSDFTSTISLIILFSHCNNNNVKESSSQRKIDSLTRVLNAIKEKPIVQEAPVNNNINKFVYVQIIYEKRFFTLSSSLGDYDVSEEEGLQKGYIADKVKVVNRQYLSGIQEIGVVTPDVKFRLLDEIEEAFREKASQSSSIRKEYSVRILKRDLKVFNSYAEASASISQIKGIDN